MPTFKNSQNWLAQSQLLLEARPSSTRITTRYSVDRQESKAAKNGDSVADAKAWRARLVLKTYDDASGTCLKYRTSKAAEVSRLVQMLGSLGRRMAALPLPEDGLLDPSPPVLSGSPQLAGSGGARVQVPSPGQQYPLPQPGAAVGGKNRKKKGKR